MAERVDLHVVLEGQRGGPGGPVRGDMRGALIVLFEASRQILGEDEARALRNAYLSGRGVRFTLTVRRA